MRSSRRTTPHVAENSVVDDATDACSLRGILAAFLADSSASLGRPFFYLIQSNGWKSLCLLTGLSVQDYSKLSFKVSLSESGITKTAPDQLGWTGTIGIPFWGGFNYEGTFTERGAVLN
jgi:hypothetical protein